MANPFGIDFKELLANPAFKAQVDEYAKGYSKGDAIAQSAGEVPMQPQVTAEAIQPEPTFIQPETTTYTGLKDTSTPDMPPTIKKEPSIYDQMQAATSQNDQKKLLYKLMTQSMQQQEAAAQSAKAALQKEQERQAGLGTLQKLDLRPFAQALRGYGSTSVGEGYAPEMTELQRQELMRKLQGQVEAATQGVTKEQVAALRTMQEDKKSAQADISLRNAEVRETKAVVEPLLKITSGGSDLLQNLGQIESVVSKKEIPVQELRQIVTKFGKVMGEVGAQTEGDRAAYYSPTIEGQINQYLNKFGASGKISVDDPSVQAIISQMKYSREQAAAGIARKAEGIAETYGSPGSVLEYQFRPGKPGHAAYRKALKLSQDMLMPKKAGAAPTKDINSMTKEELKKYLGEE
jgi:hypothetical protein